jgi:hypothetical protein
MIVPVKKMQIRALLGGIATELVADCCAQPACCREQKNAVPANSDRRGKAFSGEAPASSIAPTGLHDYGKV